MTTDRRDNFDRDLLIRLDERLVHFETVIDKQGVIAKDNFEHMLEKYETFLNIHISKVSTMESELKTKITNVERRVDKLFNYGVAALFVGVPLLQFILKLLGL